MAERRETLVNVEREPVARTVYVENGGGGGLVAGVVIAVLLIGLALFVFLRPDQGPAPAGTSITVQTPAEPKSPPAETSTPPQPPAAPARPTTQTPAQ